MEIIIGLFGIILTIFQFLLSLIIITVLMLFKPVLDRMHFPQSYENYSPDKKYVFKMFYDDPETQTKNVSGLYLTQTNQRLWAFKEKFEEDVIPLNHRYAYSYEEKDRGEQFMILTPNTITNGIFKLYDAGIAIRTFDVMNFCPNGWSKRNLWPGRDLISNVQFDEMNKNIEFTLACNNSHLNLDLLTGVVFKTGQHLEDIFIKNISSSDFDTGIVNYAKTTSWPSGCSYNINKKKEAEKLFKFISSKGLKVPQNMFSCLSFKKKYTQHLQRMDPYHSKIEILTSPIRSPGIVKLQLEVNEQTTFTADQIENLINSSFFLTQGLDLTRFPQLFFSSKILERILNSTKEGVLIHLPRTIFEDKGFSINYEQAKRDFEIKNTLTAINTPYLSLATGYGKDIPGFHKRIGPTSPFNFSLKVILQTMEYRSDVKFEDIFAYIPSNYYLSFEDYDSLLNKNKNLKDYPSTLSNDPKFLLYYLRRFKEINISKPDSISSNKQLSALWDNYSAQKK